MFHFILVHVPGLFHGPDGLSRRRRQPGDPEEPNDDHFEDWVDALYGFMHLINVYVPGVRRSSPKEQSGGTRTTVATFFSLNQVVSVSYDIVLPKFGSVRFRPKFSEP
ncbi:hypothetical protein FA95DRAFT_1614362 [Auriscalpium vulgare]|uniref:Uncharacterized protein n=1 Tax=Auriscalpium vulgare TaxID=40419 RepID=A0ACB8R007_9AGAM|nr:hypothetical protein FA95DRAFT_1614362 [Auriscalpium vulgare]